MKTGLFICDHVPLHLQSTFGDYADMFGQLFPTFDFTLFDCVKGQFPQSLSECDAYMCTGSRFSVYEKYDWIDTMKEILVELRAQEKKFIGLCFGHQLLAEALAGKVVKGTGGWCVGTHNFQIKNCQPWMHPGHKSINLLMMCQDQVVKLPSGGLLLGGNESCKNAIMQVDQNLLGIQAHPEFTKAYNRYLMKKRVEKIGATTVTDGIRTLEKTLHHHVIRDWVINFINH